MSEQNNAANFVPTPARPAPDSNAGAAYWIRRNLFAGPISWVMTPVLGLVVVSLVLGALNWSLLTSTTHGASNLTCQMAERFHLLGNAQILSSVKETILSGGVYKKLKPATVTALAGIEIGSLEESDLRGDVARHFIEDLTFDQLMTSEVLADPLVNRIVKSRFQIFNTLEKNRSDIIRRDDPDAVLHPDLEPLLSGYDLKGMQANLLTALAANDPEAIKTNLSTLTPMVHWAEENGGACWTVVKRRWQQFMYGFYPQEQVWRVAVTALLLLTGLISLMLPRREFSNRARVAVGAAIALPAGLAIASVIPAWFGVVLAAILVSCVWPVANRLSGLVPHGLIGAVIGFCFVSGQGLGFGAASLAYIVCLGLALGYGWLSLQMRSLLYVIGFPIAAIWLLIRFSLPQAVTISDGIPEFLSSAFWYIPSLLFNLTTILHFKAMESNLWGILSLTHIGIALLVAIAFLSLIVIIDVRKGNETIKPSFIATVLVGILVVNWLPSILLSLFSVFDLQLQHMPAITSARFFVGAILLVISIWLLVRAVGRQLATGGIQPLGLLVNLATVLLTFYVFFTGRVEVSDPNGIQALIGNFRLEDVVVDSIWGGLLATAVTGLTGIAVSLPLGVVLALGRKSNLPIVSWFCTGFIELVRGVPLITILFMASVLLPLFLPDGVTINKLFRALVGVSLFASAYMAEVIRGGLQGLNNGQTEGADSLGLSFWQTQRFIILPQAIKIAIPGIVNTFIGLYKDTTLLSIVGIFDLLGVGTRSVLPDLNWARLEAEVYVFIALFFFLSCFFMSQYSQYLERRLATGHEH